MTKASFYRPLIIGLLFGLVTGAIGNSPAKSELMPTCQGGPVSAAKLRVAGRVITPSLLLQTATSCGPAEKALNLLTLSRTVVISPNGTPLQNGTALLSALATISAANPSPDNPYLVKLEPGAYDLGNLALVLPPYTDLEGSGEGMSVISSTVNTTNASAPKTGLVVASSDNEIRFVRLANPANGNYMTAIFVTDSAATLRLLHVTALASGGNGSASGLYNNGGSVTVEDSTLVGTDSAGQNYGLANANGGSVVVKNSTLMGRNGGSQNVGLFNYNLSNLPTSIVVQNSTLVGLGASSWNFGIMDYTSAGTTIIQNSVLRAGGSAGSNSYGLNNANAGLVEVAASELAGDTAPANGSVTCVASYKADFSSLGVNCL